MCLISENYEKFIESIKITDFIEAKSNFVFDYFNKEDKYGLKPIHWACLTFNIEILEWMLQETCDIETSSRNGWRPIHLASFIGNKEMEKYLKDKSCKIDCKTDNGETILDVANGDCNHEFIDEILNENINLKIGLSMRLKCGKKCNHKFCLRSLIRRESIIDRLNQREKSKKLFKITDSYSGQAFSVKIIDNGDYDEYENKKCIGPKINEIISNINHSKIVKFYGVINIETKMILFMECMNVSLTYNITLLRRLQKAKLFRYCRDIVQAVAFLHDNKILHRFIHLPNIYIDNNGICKLAISNYSYSLADGDVQIDDDWLRKYKQYSLAAPELVENGILCYSYDIWLLGCTMIEMFTGNQQNYLLITFDEIKRIIPEIETVILDISNEMLQSFIRSMVMKNPTERATANELLNHEFMRNN